MDVSELELPSTLRKRRADRRAARRLAIERAVRVARLYGLHNDFATAWAKHNADNLKMCSCWMCGHTRRWFGPPFRDTKKTTFEELSRFPECDEPGEAAAL